MDQENKKELPGSVWAALKDLRLNDSNPRIIKDKRFDKLVKSIKEFPEMLLLRPIIVNKDMIILGGNMRYRACVEAGLSEVPIIIAENLTEAQELEFIIKDNVGFGEWDWDALANDWDELPLQDWGLDVPKFDPADEPTENTALKKYKIVVTCTDESEQETIFEMLNNQGYSCQKR